MGAFRYPIVIHSPDDTRKHTVEVLADTRATYLEELGYQAGLCRKLRLANGRVIEREGAEVVVEIDGARLTIVVIFGNLDTEPLLGAVTLEQFSLVPDPVAWRLVPLEALLMWTNALGRR